MSKFTDKEYREIVINDTMNALAGCDELDARIVVFDTEDRANLIVVECFQLTGEAKRRLTMLVDSYDFRIDTPRGDSKLSLVQEL